MNRLWIGIGILTVLLAMAIGVLWGSWAFFEDFTDNMEQAGASALAGNWADANQKAAKSRAQWEKFKHLWSAFTDHEPMEQMQELFSWLDVYQQKQMEVDYATVCNSLAHVAEAIEESHSLKWWSIL